MNGPHDLGGAHGHGPIAPEHNEPIFHAEWEKRVFGMFFGCFAAGQYDVDMFRSGIEQMSHAHYLDSSYYAHWIYTMERNLIDRGTLTKQEIDDRVAELAKGTH